MKPKTLVIQNSDIKGSLLLEFNQKLKLLKAKKEANMIIAKHDYKKKLNDLTAAKEANSRNIKTLTNQVSQATQLRTAYEAKLRAISAQYDSKAQHLYNELSSELRALDSQATSSSNNWSAAAYDRKLQAFNTATQVNYPQVDGDAQVLGGTSPIPIGSMVIKFISSGP